MIRIFYKFDNREVKYQNQGVKETDFAHAEILNKKGYGIFFTPNPCIGRLLKENVISVEWWFVDIDEGNKPDILNKIRSSILYPTVIIETKRGYHAYWKAINGSKENFETVENALIKHFGGDKGVKNINRLMRVPGYCHVKDLNNPFKIRIIEHNDNKYTEELMLCSFTPIKKKKKKIKKVRVNFDKLKGYDNDNAVIKEFCGRKNLSSFNENSGRRNYLLHIIGIIKKYYNLDYTDRCKVIHIINNNFACPLDTDEVDTVLKTTQ